MQPLYRIGTLARLVGLSTHAIRVWERRYGAAAPHRAPGGARLYTNDDVQRFKLIQELLERGYATRAIANLDLAALAQLASSESPPPPATDSARAGQAQAAVEALLAAITRMKVDAAERVLARASNEFSPRELVVSVLAPALEEIGSRWASGELCTASEHAASAMLRTRLGSMLAAQPVSGAPPVICTTPSGEQHELGALVVAVLIAMRGLRAIFLGANLPAGQIAEAARMSGAKSVALSLISLPSAEARRELKLIDKALPRKIEVVVGGRGTVDLGPMPERVHVLRSITDLDMWLDARSA
jgi:MerR family transcriptional regulator, light-induced transcriptional regulator